VVGIRQVMWFVMLKSAKDRVIGVDSPGQQVPPRVRYGTTSLLIRDVVVSVPCSDEWKIGIVTRLGSDGARGKLYLLHDPGSIVPHIRSKVFTNNQMS
jgi:hypothetical protein